jgi:hypothetical protein
LQSIPPLVVVLKPGSSIAPHHRIITQILIPDDSIARFGAEV